MFCSSRKGAEETAAAVAKDAARHGGRGSSSFVRDAQHHTRLTAAASQFPKNPHLRHCIAAGVGFHHAAMLPEERSAVEQLFLGTDLLVSARGPRPACPSLSCLSFFQLPYCSGSCSQWLLMRLESKLKRASKRVSPRTRAALLLPQVLCTTSTLAMGVNLPAHLVVIKSTRRYVGSEAEDPTGYEEYERSTCLQMVGRAGRPQFGERHGVMGYSIRSWAHTIPAWALRQSQLFLELTRTGHLPLQTRRAWRW